MSKTFILLVFLCLYYILVHIDAISCNHYGRIQYKDDNCPICGTNEAYDNLRCFTKCTHTKTADSRNCENYGRTTLEQQVVKGGCFGKRKRSLCSSNEYYYPKAPQTVTFFTNQLCSEPPGDYGKNYCLIDDLDGNDLEMIKKLKTETCAKWSREDGDDKLRPKTGTLQYLKG
eukprot:370453_1